MTMKSIIIRGARNNNLRGVDLDIPREKLVVITGLSGSGKSSLAFDTIYAEGQRRYVESLSVHARQYLERLNKPLVDSIEGLSPAISIEQRPLGKNPRSTVATATEIHDHLRLLFARVGRPHCPGCGRGLSRLSPQQMVDRVLSNLDPGARFAVLAPVVRGEPGEQGELLDRLRREGYVRVELDGQTRDLGEALELNPDTPHTLEVYVDRLVARDGVRSRLTDSVELALGLADGVLKVAPVQGEALWYTERLVCLACGGSLPEVTPRSFSFNSPHGACPRCAGLGALVEFDEARVVPDPQKSLREGAIAPWDQRTAPYHQELLEALARKYGFDLYAPFGELPRDIQRLVLHGTGEDVIDFTFKQGRKKRTVSRPFEGVMANLAQRMEQAQRRQKDGGRGSDRSLGDLYDTFRRFMARRPCPGCGGARLRPESLSVLLGGHNIHQLSRLTVSEALAFFDQELNLEEGQLEVGARLLHEISGRLRFLETVGVEYLTLDRPAATLSGGEGQRVRLATQIGAALTGVLYILDEPSMGLHKRDQERLLDALRHLRDLGNSVLVVEHDEDTIRAADWVVDMGPGAGCHGGEVVVAGTPEQVTACPESLTGQYLSGERRVDLPTRRRARGPRGVISLLGACHNNLREVDLELPLGLLICVTGVSGSGKSSLVVDTLLPALRAELHGAAAEAGEHRALKGAHRLDKVVAMDQSPIGRSGRSNPATYTGIFSRIRELFAGLPDSRLRGYKAGRYSFNVKGGRCEACQGEGAVRVEMHFLPDVFVKCDVCQGSRYNRETLQVRYKGLTIAQVLELSVSEAETFLGAVPAMAQRLKVLREVGLGYLSLGQPANTLSGGEAQRLKLSRELARKGTGRTLYILDEPTTGLHLADIQLLLDLLNRLVEQGNTVLIIEHHLDVIKSADHVIDMGPEGGGGGGSVVAEGTPEEVASVEGSHTGKHLRRVIGSLQ